MGAVVIADPVQYQRRRDERDDVSLPLRSLHFGPDGESLVMFLMYPPVTQGPSGATRGFCGCLG